jgi:alpha-1,3-fucosyltransferase
MASRTWKFLVLLVVMQASFLCILTISGKIESFLADTFPSCVQCGRDVTRNNFIRTIKSREWHNTTDKRIVLWTDYFDQTSASWAAEIATGLSSCEHRCTVATDKDRIQDYDAVVFHLNNIWKSPLPSYRRSDQVWILMNYEPLPFAHVHGWQAAYASEHNFNWTFWYRRDATIFAPYGSFEPQSMDSKVNYSNLTYIPKDKSRMVSMVSSNCYSDSRRYRMADELRQYVSVDTFGACGDKSCPRHNARCQNTLRKYRFHLAFENSFCRDYITEKFFDALDRDQIPIVNWKYKANADLVPAGSYVNVFDFPDMKSVAEHLINVSRNTSLYNSYFEWRRHYTLTCDQPWRSACSWCKVCAALHNSTIPAQDVHDLKSWIEDDICLPGTVCVYYHVVWVGCMRARACVYVCARVRVCMSVRVCPSV